MATEKEKIEAKREQWDTDLEFILTEWEGKTNPMLGAFRVAARHKQISNIIRMVKDKAHRQGYEEGRREGVKTATSEALINELVERGYTKVERLRTFAMW